ncbi:unnamed protein product [Sphagnum balticum]
MTGGENHPQSEMLVDRLLVDKLYLSTMAMVDLLTQVVMMPLGGGGSGPSGGGDNGLQGSGGSRHPTDQIPRSYVAR